MRAAVIFALVAVVASASVGLRASAQTDPTATPTAAPTERALGWDVACGFRFTRQVDPIVVPGSISGHTHEFFGSAISRFSTVESIRGADANGCANFAADESGYWIPSLYDREGDRVGFLNMKAYYRVAAGVDPQSVEPWPEGWEVIAGSADATGPQPIPVRSKELASWRCGQGRPPVSVLASLPFDCADPDFPSVILSLTFPDCSNGEATAPDHKSHAAYSVGGVCPETHPRHVPQLGIQIAYATSLGTNAYVSSSTTNPKSAYGMHADFMDGWDAAALQRIIDACVKDGSGCGPRAPA